MTPENSTADERPLWEPPSDAAPAPAMARFFAWVRERVSGADVPAADAPFDSWHRWSCERPAQFWPAAWEFCGVTPTPPWASMERGGTVLVRGDQMRPPGPDGPEWFPGAELNFAENLLRRRDGAVAIVARSEGGARRELTFAELAHAASCVAGALRAAGVGPGDCVAGYLPNVPEAVVAMLGAAWIGAAWTSCSPDFGVLGVLDRLGQVRPRVLVCADGYRYAGKEVNSLGRVREVVSAIGAIELTVVVPFLHGRLDDGALDGIRGARRWDDWIAAAEPAAGFARFPFSHPLYVMYSSGTTGLPKCMVHGAGGTLLQHVKEHQLHCDLGPGDRLFYFTTCGWMMWNWLVSSLASGVTIVLYDGAPMRPADPGGLWRMAAEEGVTVFGTSARFISACAAADLSPGRDYDLGALRAVLSTGSPLSPAGFDYVAQRVGSRVHLASISGGTDIVSCFMLGNPLMPVWRGEIQCAGLGMAVDVFGPDGKPVATGPGELVCTRPFPAMPVAFWGDTSGAKYLDAYFARFPGVWRHGDWVERTAHGGFVVHGRSDATLNPGGVRIGTAEIYREVEQVKGVAESAAVEQEVSDHHGGTGTRIVLFVRLEPRLELDDALRGAIRERLRANLSPHHVPKVIVQVQDIPRTLSGKVTELAIREAIHGRPVKNLDALANPESLEGFRNRPELHVSA